MSNVLIRQLEKALSKSKPHSNSFLVGLDGKETVQAKHFKPIKTEIPVLRCYNRYSSITFEDFKKLDKKNGLKYTVNGRYPFNLIHTNSYYLFFKDVDSLNSYLEETSNNNRLNETYLSFTHPERLSTYINNLVPRFMPDLDDLPEIISLSSKSKPKILRDGSMPHSSEERLANILKERQNSLHSYSGLNKTLLMDISFRLQHLSNPDIINYPTISRSNCVILRNVPSRIDSRKILDFLWDLDWSHHESLQLRPMMVDRITHFSTYVLCFANRYNASQCIRRIDGNHLFYDSNLPIVTAEFL